MGLSDLGLSDLLDPCEALLCWLLPRCRREGAARLGGFGALSPPPADMYLMVRPDGARARVLVGPTLASASPSPSAFSRRMRAASILVSASPLSYWTLYREPIGAHARVMRPGK